MKTPSVFASEVTPILGKNDQNRPLVTLYNVLLLTQLSLLMFMTGVQYNISQMVSYHQSCEWSVPHTFLALEPTVLVAVIGLAALVTGILSDKFGRKTIMIGVVAFLSTGILLCGLSRELIQYEIGRMIIGGSIGALFNLCIVMWLESSPIGIRKFGVLVMMVMSSLGHASIVLYDYALMIPYGWNVGLLFNLVVLVPAYIIMFKSHETPMFLLSKGRTHEAFTAARKCGMIDEDMHEIKKNTAKSASGSLLEIFSSTYRWISLKLILLFGLHRMVEVGLIFGVPYLLAVNFCDEPERIAQNMTNWDDEPADTFKCLHFSANDYLFIFSFAILGIPGYVIGAVVQSNYLKIPVRYGLLVLSMIVGILLVWCSICDSYLYWLLELKLGFLRVFISSQDQMFSVLIPAVFPTHIRNGASGLIRACGIVLSSSGPFLTIWFFNSFSVTWCLVAQAVIYLGRIPLTWGLKVSTGNFKPPTDQKKSEKDNLEGSSESF